MDFKGHYIFNVLLDDESDLVVLTVGGFGSNADRESFADDLHYTLSAKKLELYTQKTEDIKDFLEFLDFKPKNATIH